METKAIITVDIVDIHTVSAFQNVFKDGAYVRCNNRIYTSVEDVIVVSGMVDMIADYNKEELPNWLRDIYTYSFSKLVRFAKAAV